MIIFFFNDTATTEIYTLSLHDALPICWVASPRVGSGWRRVFGDALSEQHRGAALGYRDQGPCTRSEEHTSELQSPCNIVCRLLLEKKKEFAVPCVTASTKGTTRVAAHH